MAYRPRKLLKSNYSPGLAALTEVASTFGEVRVVAPDVEQSSMGHAITHSRPLTVRRTSLGAIGAWRANGTPADCVALGVALWTTWTSCCRASTSAPTWATRCGTRAPSRPPSRPRCSVCGASR